jgi:hypothetical protein
MKLIKTYYGYMITTEEGFLEINNVTSAVLEENRVITNKGIFYLHLIDGVPKISRVHLS